jgi:putative transposase
LKVVSKACAQAGWLVHAWVLMSNHYHLCIEAHAPR